MKHHSLRKLFAGGAALAVLSGLALAQAGNAGVTDPITGPGIVQDLTVDVATAIPAVVDNFTDGAVGDLPVTVTVNDEGLVPNIFGSRVTLGVPAGFTVVPEFTDCPQVGQDVVCSVTASDVGTAFNVYLRTSTPGDYTITADLAVANAAEALIEYDDNNSDSASFSVIDDDSRLVAALEPGECAKVEQTADSDTHQTCNNASHPIITTTEYIADTSGVTCNGETCEAQHGWKTGQILVPGYADDAGYVIGEVVNFGIDVTPCQGVGQGSECAQLVHGQNAEDTDYETTPWCYGDDGVTFTAEALADVQCVVDVVKVKVDKEQVRTWILLAKITDDPPKLPLSILDR